MMTRPHPVALVVAGLILTMVWTPPVLAQMACDCSGQPYAEMQVAGNPRVQLELATNDAERQRGLGFRYSLDRDAGMLFVFDTLVTIPFCNCNTYIPLDIAFLASDGTILDIQHIRPEVAGQPNDLYPSSQPFRYALEVNDGWFASHGVAVGDPIKLCLPMPQPQAAAVKDLFFGLRR